MTQQTQNANKQDVTVRIPDNVRVQQGPQVTPAPAGKVKSEKKQKKGSSTVVDSVLDRIFQQEKQQTVEALSIQADSSKEFRSRLEMVGKKYKIEKVVATGGFGRIFQVEDRVLGRKAIVKSLKEEFLQNEKVMEHFITEAKLNSQLDHPGIVPLFSLDSDVNKGLHLAMQKISGITLKVYLDRCRDLQLEQHFSQKIYNKMLAERLEVFLHICDTISYCHDRKVLHNDLKPSNIMIGRYGQVYVMDWGIASVDGEQKPNQNIGSPAYMAPERLCSHIQTRQTDIFALGMILNEMVTLRPSIESQSVSDVVERICTGQFEPSTCVDPQRRISIVLRSIIEKARNPNPQERYSSVQMLSDDIRHYLFKEETVAYPDSIAQKVFRFLFHHRRFSISLVGGIVLLFVAAVIYNFYNAGVITRKAGRETIWKLNLVKSMDSKSDAIGKKLLLLQEQTANMGSALAIEYGKKLYDSNAPYYWNEDFAPRSKHRPPGLIHTAAYKGGSITLSTGTFYRFRDRIPEQEIQDWANNFRAQQSQHLANVLAHIHKKEIAYKSDKLKLFYEYGSTVQRIICVLDNGLVYCYPGKYEFAASADAFIPEGVRRELRSGKDFVWSSPYRDPVTGLIVVSSWSTISSLRGNRIGVIGMVVVYEDLLKDFLDQIKQNPGPAIYTLVDSEARIIYSSVREFELFHLQTNPDEEVMIGKHSYKWYSEVIRRIRMNPSQNQFTAVLNRRPFNVTWKQLPSSKWLLIQHVPLNGQESAH